MVSGVAQPCSLASATDPAAPPLYGIWIFDPASGTQKPILTPQEGVIFTDIVAAMPRRNFATTTDPLDRIFAILAGYRERILRTNCQYGCPLGRLALEIDPENRPAHKLIAENFRGWIGAVRECLEESRNRLAPAYDRPSLRI